MTDGQVLLALLAALYLIDCIRWLPPQGHPFRRWWGSRWSWKRNRASVTVRGLRPVLANPLPTLGTFLAADDWPAVPHPDGLILPGKGGALTKAVPWEKLDLHRRPENKKLRLYGRRHVHFSSRASARFWSELLKNMRESDGKADLTTAFAPTFSMPRARAATRRYHLGASCTTLWANQLFFLCFAALPALIWRRGDHPATYAAAGLMLLVLLLTAASYFRACGRAFPSLRPGRWSATFLVGAVPFHAMRAHDQLALEAAGPTHPIALGAATLRDEDFARLASALWRRWRFCKGGPQRATPLLEGIKTVAATRGLTIADLEAPPAPQPGCAAYCPRCHSGYIDTTSHCDDCAGIPTLPFPE